MSASESRGASRRGLYLLLLVFFSLAYMEWGGGNHSFVFEVQRKVFTEPERLIANLTHPVILVGFAGQIVLLMAFFNRTLRSAWIVTAIGLLAIPVALILLSGALAGNFRVIGSTVPYLALATWLLLELRKAKRQRTNEQRSS